MALVNTDYPPDHPNHGKTLRLDSFAKAIGYEFPPWTMVKVSTARQEAQIAEYCRGKVPISIFDWNDEDMVMAYFRRHPEHATLKEDGTPDVNALAKLVARSHAPERPFGQATNVGPGGDIATIPASQTRGGPGQHGKRDKSESRGEANE